MAKNPAKTPRSDDLAGTRNQRKPKNPRYAGPEPRIGKIECHPAPDAEDRLRRLFTLLASHLPSGEMTEPESGCPSSSPTEGGDE